MQSRGRNAVGPESRYLIIHQRDKRRYDHRTSLGKQCRHLVTHGFSATGRHQHDCVASRSDSLDYLKLTVTERIVTVEALEQYLSLEPDYIIIHVRMTEEPPKSWTTFRGHFIIYLMKSNSRYFGRGQISLSTISSSLSM